MIKFREHRGSLAEAMGTVVNIQDKKELIDIIKDRLSPYCHGLEISNETVEVSPYGFDNRIIWDTHIVILKGYSVFGFTDAAVDT